MLGGAGAVEAVATIKAIQTGEKIGLAAWASVIAQALAYRTGSVRFVSSDEASCRAGYSGFPFLHSFEYRASFGDKLCILVCCSPSIDWLLNS